MTLIQIKVVKDEFTPLIKKLGSQAVGRSLGDAGQDTAKNVARELRNASMQWKSISNSIYSRRTGNINKVFVHRKGIALDSMRPHYVALKPGRRITKWVEGKGHLTMKHGRSKVFWREGRKVIWRRKGIKSKLYVTPTPWIKRPLNRGIKKAPRYVRKHIMRLIKSRGAR